MTDLTKDEIVKMARECNLMDGLIPVQSQLERFATLCRAPLVAEVERLEQWHAEMADNRNAIASERDTLKAELARVRAVPVPKDWRDAVQEFVTRCESGEVRSKFIEACFEKLRAGVELPEPFGLFCGVRHDPPKTKEFWGMLNENARQETKCDLFTRDQLLQYGAAQRLAGREQAITEVIQRLNSNTYNLTKQECISEIRNMKGQP